MSREIVLIDLSSIAYPVWMTSGSNPDPNYASQQIVARVHALAANQAHVAVCCDSRTSFRRDLEASYKANRPEREEALHHQIRLAKEALQGDGFPLWEVDGFEADDVIGSAVAKALALPETSVLVVTGDKDLCQLVGPRVRVMTAQKGDMLDADAVAKKFGVRPDQVRDYLCLVGDASDNIKGSAGIGPVKAAQLLAKFNTLDYLYERLDQVGGANLGIPPAVSKSLREFRHTLDLTRKLIDLRTDVPVPFDQVLGERTPSTSDQGFGEFVVEDDDQADDEPLPEPRAAAPVAEPVQTGTVLPAEGGDAPAKPSGAPALHLARREAATESGLVLPAPIEWERGLDPRSMREARQLALDMHRSRMFGAYGSPEAVLSTVMVGRELGLPAMASLRSIHNIEGKHSLSASLMVALVLRSGLAEFFEPIEFSETSATYETKRRTGRSPITLTHTIEMAWKAWPKGKTEDERKRSFEASGWGRNPTDMLVARATSRLARMVYPDLLAGLYTPEELEEIRLAKAA